MSVLAGKDPAGTDLNYQLALDYQKRWLDDSVVGLIMGVIYMKERATIHLELFPSISPKNSVKGLFYFFFMVTRTKTSNAKENDREKRERKVEGEI